MKDAEWSDDDAERLRDTVKEPATRKALDVLMKWGVESPAFRVRADRHGAIRELRYFEAASTEQPFAFIANRAHLLFYLRKPATRRLRATALFLRKHFDQVSEPREGEITIRVRTPEDARRVIATVLDPATREFEGSLAITYKDGLRAIEALERGEEHTFRGSTRYDLFHEGKRYPPKAVYGLAARRSLGRELTAREFQSNKHIRNVLSRLGFTITGKDPPASKIEEPPPDLKKTEKHAVIKTRLAQRLFRMRLMAVDRRCRVTGVADPQFLRASHIQPWAKSDDTQRQDPNNGLLLAPHVDHLFDSGYLTFEDDGTVRFSSALDREVLKAWGLDRVRKVAPFSAGQAVYLEYHRKYVFQGSED